MQELENDKEEKMLELSTMTEKNNYKIAIVVSDFNDEITGKMLETAKKTAEDKGAEIVKIIHVPGAYDIPIIALQLMQRDDVNSIVALGAVVEGETDHDDVIVRECASRLSQLSLSFSKPVGLGVVGPGVKYDKCVARCQDYAKRAVCAAIKLIDAQKEALNDKE
jgi:6,7-dimethyl-8-ribityllumazine synthase